MGNYSHPLGAVLNTAPAVEASAWPTGIVLRSVADLREHPAYAELQLSVLPAQFAAIKRLGNLGLRDPLLVTNNGVIIDGYARKAYADSLGAPTLACVEFDIGEEEALRMILRKHHRSPGWNDYNRIRMASKLEDVVQTQARTNQQTGGHLKGLSNLTEANVRKEIAAAAGVSEGNVAKVNQLREAEPGLLKALASGEITIHRAWLWRGLTWQQQCEELRRYRLLRDLKQPAKTRALSHRAARANRIVLTVGKLKELLQQASAMHASDLDHSELVEIGVLRFPGKTVLLTAELYEALWSEGLNY